MSSTNPFENVDFSPKPPSQVDLDNATPIQKWMVEALCYNNAQTCGIKKAVEYANSKTSKVIADVELIKERHKKEDEMQSYSQRLEFKKKLWVNRISWLTVTGIGGIIGAGIVHYLHWGP